MKSLSRDRILSAPVDVLLAESGAIVCWVTEEDLRGDNADFDFEKFTGASMDLVKGTPVLVLPTGRSAGERDAATRLLLARALGVPTPELITPFRFREVAAA